jgi:DNA mismatch repair protein MutS2
MNAAALRALEFDRIVSVLTGLAVTPTGATRLAGLLPSVDAAQVRAAQQATTEGVQFLAVHPGFPLRAPADLASVLEALSIEGRALEPARLVALADYVESIDHARTAVTSAAAPLPRLRVLVGAVASFKAEIGDVRRKIDAAGEVNDNASPALANIRERVRKQRARLRTTLESFLHGRDTAKYLQDQIVTDRNGRYVLVVRAEHRSSIPGIIHGTSASGASLFLEPLETVDVNNDIVALEEQEAEEVRRILLELTDAFRDRGADLQRTVDVATELDVIQARARFSQVVDGVEPVIAADSALELRGARHPLLKKEAAVPVDILLSPPIRVLVITGPNTGGKTVALKTAGLFVAMAQAGLHLPAEKGSRLPIFQSLFADIGDEQSIAASLSTFSAHITNVVSMDRNLAEPALVLLDEVGAGTDPIEGGALGIAVIDHFRRRGAHLIATTHYDSLKSYASTTEGVVSAAFGFNPESFAPTYRLVYGSPGRSLAIEIAARLGMPKSVIAAARENLTEPEKQLAEHLARVDDDLRRLEQQRHEIARERSLVSESERRLRAREDSVAEREERVRRRLDAKLDDQLRDARKAIDSVVDGLKKRAAELEEKAAIRLNTAGSPPRTPARWGANAGGKLRAAGLSTGELGAIKSDARAALEQVAASIRGEGAQAPDSMPPDPGRRIPDPAIAPGSRVIVGALGLEGTVIDVQGNHAEVDVRGKRLRAALWDLRLIGAASPKVNVTVDLQPREGALAELNIIGATVDDALERLAKFLDTSTMSDLGELRIVHGYGTGQLRRAVAKFLKDHPLVERFKTAPEDQGGGGATIVVLKD